MRKIFCLFLFLFSFSWSLFSADKSKLLVDPNLLEISGNVIVYKGIERFEIDRQQALSIDILIDQAKREGRYLIQKIKENEEDTSEGSKAYMVLGPLKEAVIAAQDQSRAKIIYLHPDNIKLKRVTTCFNSWYNLSFKTLGGRKYSYKLPLDFLPLANTVNHVQILAFNEEKGKKNLVGLNLEKMVEYQNSIKRGESFSANDIKALVWYTKKLAEKPVSVSEASSQTEEVGSRRRTVSARTTARAVSARTTARAVSVGTTARAVSPDTREALRPVTYATAVVEGEAYDPEEGGKEGEGDYEDCVQQTHPLTDVVVQK